MVPLFALAFVIALPSPAMPQPAHTSFLDNSAHATATVTIVTPARVGETLGPPRPGMTPRVAALSVPGGRDRLLLIYDFE